MCLVSKTNKNKSFLKTQKSKSFLEINIRINVLLFHFFNVLLFIYLFILKYWIAHMKLEELFHIFIFLGDPLEK